MDSLTAFVKQVMDRHDDVLDETGDCDLCLVCLELNEAARALREIKGFADLAANNFPGAKALEEVAKLAAAALDRPPVPPRKE